MVIGGIIGPQGDLVTLYTIDCKTYTSLEPRLASRLLISPQLSLKASYTRMSQYVHQLNESYINLPTDTWMPVSHKLKPMQSVWIPAFKRIF